MKIKTIYGLGQELNLKDPYGKNYHEVLNHVIDSMQRDMTNWRKGEINAKRNRLEAACRKALEVWENGQDTIEVEYKTVRKGVAVLDTRKQVEPNEVLLSAAHGLQILDTDRKLLEKYEDTWLDWAADEYFVGGSGWDCSLCSSFVGRLDFVYRNAVSPHSDYAAVVAVRPRVTGSSIVEESTLLNPLSIDSDEVAFTREELNKLKAFAKLLK